jgi:hypothetical protein
MYPDNPGLKAMAYGELKTRYFPTAWGAPVFSSLHALPD